MIKYLGILVNIQQDKADNLGKGKARRFGTKMSCIESSVGGLTFYIQLTQLVYLSNQYNLDQKMTARFFDTKK